MTEKRLSDTVASRVRLARHARGWQTGDLAGACADAGYPELTENVIENIESGRRDPDGRRRRDITVDELRAFARALDMTMSELLFGERGGIRLTTPESLRRMADYMEESGISFGDERDG